MIHGVKRLFEEITTKDVRTQVPIKEGITNENYLINDAYVFRMPRKDHDEFINYKLEKEVYEKIEPLKISEKVIFLDDKKGIKISKFVHNTRFYVNTPNEEQMRYVSKILKKLHSSKIKVSKEYDAIKKINYYKKYVDSAAFIDEKYEKIVFKEIASLDDKKEYCLCHNDHACRIEELHCHFHCEACGKTFCLDNVHIPVIHYPAGYEVREINYLVKGRCPDCRSKR